MISKLNMTMCSKLNRNPGFRGVLDLISLSTTACSDVDSVAIAQVKNDSSTSPLTVVLTPIHSNVADVFRCRPTDCQSLPTKQQKAELMPPR